MCNVHCRGVTWPLSSFKLLATKLFSHIVHQRKSPTLALREYGKRIHDMISRDHACNAWNILRIESVKRFEDYVRKIALSNEFPLDQEDGDSPDENCNTLS